MKMTRVLGISGYISSGKSQAGRFFKEKGFCLIDADEVVDELYAPGEAGWIKVSDHFGRDFLKEDGNVDRGKLARHVFADARRLNDLNDLIHPLVNESIRKRLVSCKDGYAAVEAAYFREKRLLDLVDAVLWIECERDAMLKRAQANGIDEDLFSMILAAQEKPARTDFIVRNDGSVSDLRAKLERVYRKLVFEV